MRAGTEGSEEMTRYHKCWTCGGSGRVVLASKTTSRVTRQCPECGGDGYVISPEDSRPPQKDPPSKSYPSFSDAWMGRDETDDHKEQGDEQSQ